MRLRIKDLATKVGSGVTPKGGASVYQDNGIPLFRSQNVTNDGFLLDDIAYNLRGNTQINDWHSFNAK